MARPKRLPGEKTALEKIEEAFWQLLAVGEYADISIRTLALQAGVNHNTIYYYYENIDDMAAKLFKRNMPIDILQTIIIDFIMGADDVDIGSVAENEELLARWYKGRLFTRGDSMFLTNIFKTSVRDAWLGLVGIAYDDLADSDKVDIEFIFNGLTAVIGSPLTANNPQLMSAIFQRDLGKGIAATFKRLSEFKPGC